MISFPSKITRPSSGMINPPIIRSVVVFPHPDGPSKVTNSFLPISMLRSSRIFFPSKDFDRCPNLKLPVPFSYSSFLSFFLKSWRRAHPDQLRPDGTRVCNRMLLVGRKIKALSCFYHINVISQPELDMSRYHVSELLSFMRFVFCESFLWLQHHKKRSI